MELLFNDASRLKIIDDEKSLYTRMDVLDLIYHQFLLTANTLGRQLTTSQFIQPLSPQTLAHVAAAIHCELSEYATGKKVTVMFLKVNIEVNSALPWWYIELLQKPLHSSITHGGAASYPPPPPQVVLLRYNRHSSIPVRCPQSG